MSRVHAGDKKLHIKRLPVKVDRTKGILLYDVDNLYPQRMDEIIKRSGTGTRAVNKLSQFIRGRGFVDKKFGESVINSRGMTVNNLLRFVSKDKAGPNGVALHIQYNMLGEVAGVNPLKFDYVRFGIPDEQGKIRRYAYSYNWEKDRKKEPDGNVKPHGFYPAFDPNPDVVKRQIEEAGGIQNYKGQIFVWTPELNEYPLSTFDPVVDDIQANSEIPLYQLKSIQNGFSAGGVFKYPGTFENETEKNEAINDVNANTGPEAANSVTVIEMGNVDLSTAADLFETFEMQNIDNMFVNQIKNIKDSISENYGMPDPVLGRNKSGGIFTSEEYEQSYMAYNTETAENRQDVSSIFKEVFTHFFIDVNPSDNWEIEPAVFGDNKKDPTKIPTELYKDMTSTERRELIGLEPLEDEGAEDQQLLAEKLGTGTTQTLVDILTNEALNSQQKINMIIALFNFSPEEAEKIVNPEAEQTRQNVQS